MSLINYSSKILLFGEYTILNGSKALAVPFNHFSGHWDFDKKSSDSRTVSRSHLERFLSHDWSSILDMAKLEKDFDSGLWFNSTIPQGYGLGSSGAVVAALLGHYAKNKTIDIAEIKNNLAVLESFFHGSSSGLDPLVSYLNKPISILNVNNIEVIQKNVGLKGFFLLNSARPRKTGALVEIYREKIKDKDFQDKCLSKLSPLVDKSIDSLLSLDKDVVFQSFYEISKIQWGFFQEMIPSQLKQIWTIGLEKGDYLLKLCGAGGGGYFLGYSHNPESTQRFFENQELDFRWL
jgi:mevalonate kinase